MSRSIKSGSNKSKARHFSNEIPAASEEWFDAFTSDGKPPSSSSSTSSKRPTNYRANKFNTADLIRNIKEANSNHEASNKRSGKPSSIPSLNELIRNFVHILHRYPPKTILQLIVVFIATCITLEKLVSMSLNYGSHNKSDYLNNVATINYGDSSQNLSPVMQQQQQNTGNESPMLRQQQQALPFQEQDLQQLQSQQQFSSSSTERTSPEDFSANHFEHERLKQLEKSAFLQNAQKDKHTKTKPQPQTGQVPGPLYYNLGSATPIPLSYKDYPAGGPAIAILVTNHEKDIRELTTALQSLEFLQGDLDPSHKAPILCFNEGDLSEDQIQIIIKSCPDRPISFPTVDFTEFPPGFHPEEEEVKFKVKGRKDWGYYHMIRFWVTGIWRHSAIDHFETIMRIDSDSCFKEANAYLPNFMNDELYYHSQYVGFEGGAEYVHGLYDFAVNYMKTVRIPSEPRNFLLWHFTTTVWTTMDTLPLFRSNFEVSRVSFMRRKDLTLWHEALTEHEPYGVYRYRWGDAVTRFLTAGMFENQDRIMTIRPTGYYHKIGCSPEEVEEALQKWKKEQEDSTN